MNEVDVSRVCEFYWIAGFVVVAGGVLAECSAQRDLARLLMHRN
jgi:hypothetical protein